MPELPEVETVRRGLARCMTGRQIVRAELRRPDLHRVRPVFASGACLLYPSEGECCPAGGQRHEVQVRQGLHAVPGVAVEVAFGLNEDPAARAGRRDAA